MENFEKIPKKGNKRLMIARIVRRILPRCNGKHSYRTEERAEHVRRRRQVDADVPLYIYRCPHFHCVQVIHWHLTHKPPRK